MEVWSVNLDCASGDVCALSRSERARAARLERPRDRIRSLEAYCAVRRILADQLRTNPRCLEFEKTTSGKPFLSTPTKNLRFNLSHSGRHGLIAVAKDRSVGVDIEVLRPVTDLLEVALQIATAQEAKRLRQLPSAKARIAFFGLWTRKEAALKAMGHGFLIDPREIQVGIGPGRSYVDFDERIWTVESLRIGPNVTAAVSIEGIFDMPAVVRSLSELNRAG